MLTWAVESDDRERVDDAMGCTWFACVWTFLVVMADEINLRVVSSAASVIDTGYGFSAQEKDGQNSVLQLMQYIPEGPFPHAWGIEVGFFSVLTTPNDDLKYHMVSLFVESTPFKSVEWLRVNIGTAGYFGKGRSSSKVFGFRSAIGAEVPISERFSLLGFIRRDIIFDEESSALFSALFSAQFGVQMRLR